MLVAGGLYLGWLTGLRQRDGPGPGGREGDVLEYHCTGAGAGVDLMSEGLDGRASRAVVFCQEGLQLVDVPVRGHATNAERPAIFRWPFQVCPTIRHDGEDGDDGQKAKLDCVREIHVSDGWTVYYCTKG